MFRIGEFSKLTQVSVRMLRYYDDAGLLKPAAVDQNTGYRYYSSEQAQDLQKILLLRDFGCPVSDMAALLAIWGSEGFERALTDMKVAAQAAAERERERIARIEEALAGIGGDGIARQYNFMIKKIPAVNVVSLRRVADNYFCEGELWKELGYCVKANGIATAGGYSFAVYHDEEFKEQNVDIEVCVPASGVLAADATGGISFRRVEAVEAMACALVHGPFENIRGAYLSFAGWLARNEKYEMRGANRQICHRGPWNEDAPEKYLTEIQIPVIKTPAR